MLTRQEKVSSPEQYYADSLLTKPTMAETVFGNFFAGVGTPMLALYGLADENFAQRPEGRALVNALHAVQMTNETSGMGWGQKSANYVASIIGYGVNPITWGFGSIGSLAGRTLGVVAEKIAPNAVTAFMRKPLNSLLGEKISKWLPTKFLPETIGKTGEEKTLSTALLSQKTIDTFGTFAGAGIPQGIVDNFNFDKGHINWGGVAREAGEMGAFGIAIGSIPFGLGVLRAKINRGLGEATHSELTPDKASLALENKQITPEEYQWYIDLLEHEKNPADIQKMKELQDRATELVNKNGHTANVATNEVKFDILTDTDMRNLQSVIPDQLVSDLPANYKTALSDFLIHNRLDEIRENPSALDGVRGYVDFINKKLESKPAKLAEANKIMDEHMIRGMKEEMPISQNELLKNIRKIGLDAKSMKQLGIVVPDNIRSRIKMERQVQQIKDKIKIYKKRLAKTNDPHFQSRIDRSNKTINKIEKELPRILHPHEELQEIRSKLLTDKGLPKNWERSDAYHRLVDLAHVWHNARSLLDRVHLEHDYERQEAFKSLADSVIQVVDSDVPRLANPENVVGYLKSRLEGQISKPMSMDYMKQQEKFNSEVPADADSILDQQEVEVEKTTARKLAEEYEYAADRFKEFKSSENVFKNLISCVMGSLNG